jgi:hypothetical protein
LLNQCWNKKKERHRAPSIIALIQRANRLSFFIGSLILVHDKVEERQQVVEKIMHIAKDLRKYNNFHTLMGIIAGLNTSSVSRLKKTFDGISADDKAVSLRCWRWRSSLFILFSLSCFASI